MKTVKKIVEGELKQGPRNVKSRHVLLFCHQLGSQTLYNKPAYWIPFSGYCILSARQLSIQARYSVVCIMGFPGNQRHILIQWTVL
jgi:hypothetical protein